MNADKALKCTEQVAPILSSTPCTWFRSAELLQLRSLRDIPAMSLETFNISSVSVCCETHYCIFMAMQCFIQASV